MSEPQVEWDSVTVQGIKLRTEEACQKMGAQFVHSEVIEMMPYIRNIVFQGDVTEEEGWRNFLDTIAAENSAKVIPESVKFDEMEIPELGVHPIVRWSVQMTVGP